MCEDAEIVLVAYGTPARIAQSAAEELRRQGVKAGVFRPITVWPYPYDRLRALAAQSGVKAFVVVEMSSGQMLDDVNLAVSGQKPVRFYGRMGGVIPGVSEVEKFARNVYEEVC